ncbi:hypothetical protein [Orrella marina]|nr:hypothetical protein [Orrella marina]
MRDVAHGQRSRDVRSSEFQGFIQQRVPQRVRKRVWKSVDVSDGIFG